MYIATVTLKNVSPYSQSRHHDELKRERELPNDYEARTWRKRLHVDADGLVIIPPMAFKNALSEAAKFLSRQIPGKGKATYTKHFEAGVLVTEPAQTGLKASEIEGEWLFLPSDGKRGSGTRVMKCYPRIDKWQVQVRFYILDEIITQDVFTDHLDKAGKFIGIGRFRPRNNGYYGRFEIVDVNWQEA
jgi:hypothetical protein